MAESKQAVSWSFGRGRGFRPSQPFKPARRPGEPAPQTSLPSTDSTTTTTTTTSSSIQSDFNTKCNINPSGDRSKKDEAVQSSGSNSLGNKKNEGSEVSNGNGRSGSTGGGSEGKVSTAGLKGGVTKLKSKYSYKAHPASPLGQKELSIQQGVEVVFLETCAENGMWWKVQTENGDEGFVPASYLEVKSDKLTQLPWLAAKQSAEEAELPKVKPEWKPYVSAYNRDGNVKEGGSSANKEQYYCKWCDKQLNGPKPYGAHITSKAHKEEIELAKEYGTYTED